MMNLRHAFLTGSGIDAELYFIRLVRGRKRAVREACRDGRGKQEGAERSRRGWGAWSHSREVRKDRARAVHRTTRRRRERPEHRQRPSSAVESSTRATRRNTAAEWWQRASRLEDSLSRPLERHRDARTGHTDPCPRVPWACTELNSKRATARV